MLWEPGSLEVSLPVKFHMTFCNDKNRKWNSIQVLGSEYCDIKGWKGHTGHGEVCNPRNNSVNPRSQGSYWTQTFS